MTVSIEELRAEAAKLMNECWSAQEWCRDSDGVEAVLAYREKAIREYNESLVVTFRIWGLEAAANHIEQWLRVEREVSH